MSLALVVCRSSLYVIGEGLCHIICNKLTGKMVVLQVNCSSLSFDIFSILEIHIFLHFAS